LAAFAAPSRLNTDDLPVVAYGAPRITYAPDSLPRERLMTLLATLQVSAADVLDVAADPAGGARLAAYWQARSRFLEAGLRVRPTADPQRMLTQVRDPLLAALKISPDFRPAYDPLLQLARALSRSDAAAARSLMEELVMLQPAWPQAAQALAQLPAQAR
jgi:spermidine synthase